MGEVTRGANLYYLLTETNKMRVTLTTLVWLWCVCVVPLTAQAMTDWSETLPYAIEQGWTTADTDGRGLGSGVGPQTPVTALDFVVTLIKTTDFSVEGARFGTEVPAGIDPESEDAQYLREAVRRGLVKVEQWQGDRKISQGQGLSDVLRVMGLSVTRVDEPSEAFLAALPERLTNSPWRNALQAGHERGLLDSDDVRTFTPQATLTRGQFYSWLRGGEIHLQFVRSVKRAQAREQYVPYGDGEERTVEINLSDASYTQNEGAFAELNTAGAIDEVVAQILAQYQFREEITPAVERRMVNAAISAMVGALGDDYSVYIPPAETDEYREAVNTSSYEGIGAHVEVIEGFLVITSPIVGSPAEKAGVVSGDKVVAVDGEPVVGWPVMEIIGMIKGEAGTDVTLTIQRTGRQFDLTVTRGEITIPPLTLKEEKGIPILGLHQFKPDMKQEFQQMVREIAASNPRGLVIDLRNNPGGSLEAALVVAETLLAEDDVIATMYRGETKNQFGADDDGLLLGVPVAVVVNEGSASASEIIAGIVQDHELGKVIGTQTFGKGTVQGTSLIGNNGAALKLTVGVWHTPNGRWIEGEGIVPDIVVGNPTPAQIEAEYDPQLSRALDYIIYKR